MYGKQCIKLPVASHLLHSELIGADLDMSQVRLKQVHSLMCKHAT